MDTDYLGEIQSQKGITFGYLPQEPALDPEATVLDIVQEGAAEAVQLMKDYNAVSEKFAEPDADYEVLMEQQAKLQDKIDAMGAWDLESRLEMAMDALRCPPAEAKIGVLVWG